MSLRQARGAKSHIPEIPFIRSWEYNPHGSVNCGLIDSGFIGIFANRCGREHEFTALWEVARCETEEVRASECQSRRMGAN